MPDNRAAMIPARMEMTKRILAVAELPTWLGCPDGVNWSNAHVPASEPDLEATLWPGPRDEPA
jgi:hypothetical protein